MGKVHYQIAWENLLMCLRNGWSLDIWVAPIPKEDRERMIKSGKRFIEKEKQPSLFKEM